MVGRMAGERITDGQMEWIAGVDSDVVRTIQSPFIPNGLKRNQLAWLENGTVRGGSIGQRPGFQPRVQGAPWSGIFQGGFMYQPDFNDAQIILAIGGRLWRVRVDTGYALTDLSGLYGLTMPSDQPQAFFSQAEMFLVWQCGDLTTKPIFYDFGIPSVRGETMRRSLGFVGVNDPTNEIPPAGPSDYFSQRLWYSLGRLFIAGDIALNQTSGTATYGYRDSVIHSTENPVATAGDAFIVPTTAGNIRALKHASNIDTNLGESPLFVFTRRTVYAASPPLTRADWTSATFDNMPIQKVALARGGTFAERSVVAVNQDLFYQSTPNGDIRSLSVAVRNFKQWGNIPISSNENRALVFNDRSLLHMSSGVEFDNRLLQTVLPVQTPVGVGFRGIIPLDFNLISSLEDRLPPAWEGIYSGMNVLQLLEADIGGVDRCFAVIWSDVSQQIEIWEITNDQRFENGEQRVRWRAETPAYTWNDPTKLKRLEALELWFDKILGTVDVKVFYRPDSWPCFIPYREFKICAARDCREDLDAPCVEDGYPKTQFCEGDRTMIMLPKPPTQCIPNNNRPSDIFYQCQFRIEMHGWTRIRGILAHALPVEKRPWENLIC